MISDNYPIIEQELCHIRTSKSVAYSFQNQGILSTRRPLRPWLVVHGAISHQKRANLKAENEPKCVAGSGFALAATRF
jgi:hypothetical protein